MAMKPGERRLQILQTLAAMLENPRAEKVTTAALAARLDVSEAALYRHFASKAQMFEGLIEFIEQSVFTLVNQIVERCQALFEDLELNAVKQWKAAVPGRKQHAFTTGGVRFPQVGPGAQGQRVRIDLAAPPGAVPIVTEPVLVTSVGWKIRSGPAAFGEAAVTPADIKYVSIYDSFTITVLMQLEDLGFCRKGEGGPFVEGGAIAVVASRPDFRGPSFRKDPRRRAAGR